MCQVYSQAIVTLAAAFQDHCDGGVSAPEKVGFRDMLKIGYIHEKYRTDLSLAWTVNPLARRGQALQELLDHPKCTRNSLPPLLKSLSYGKFSPSVGCGSRGSNTSSTDVSRNSPYSRSAGHYRRIYSLDFRSPSNGYRSPMRVS